MPASAVGGTRYEINRPDGETVTRTESAALASFSSTSDEETAHDPVGGLIGRRADPQIVPQIIVRLEIDQLVPTGRIHTLRRRLRPGDPYDVVLRNLQTEIRSGRRGCRQARNIPTTAANGATKTKSGGRTRSVTLAEG